MSKSCIFHAPWAVNNECLVPSEIRPRRLIEALQNIGYQVDVVMGHAKQRAIAIRQIKSNIKNGKKYDFLYSESSTLPTILTETHHYPLHPFLDFSFFSFCKKNNIPIGVFLRDIFWAFPGKYRQFNFLKEQITTAFHKYDIYKYNQFLDALFLPSTRMTPYVKGLHSSIPCVDLPPGTDLFDCPKERDRRVFAHVSGISSALRNIDALFDVFSQMPELKLIISFPEKLWSHCKSNYHHKITPNIEIVHYRSNELNKIYDLAGYSLYFAHENTYNSIGVPYKLYEYISYETPIISNRNNAVSNYIEENHVGYICNNDSTDLLRLIQSLPNYEDYEIIRQNIRLCKAANTWEIRAEQIAKTLLGKS